MRITKTRVARIIREEVGRLFESVSRHCELWKDTKGQWWLDLADREYAGPEDATTYGPFVSQDATDRFLSDNFSNPGSFYEDGSGTRAPPSESPNGRPVVDARRFRDRMGSSWSSRGWR